MEEGRINQATQSRFSSPSVGKGVVLYWFGVPHAETDVHSSQCNMVVHYGLNFMIQGLDDMSHFFIENYNILAMFCSIKV